MNPEGTNRIVNARDRRGLKFRKEVDLSADIQALWEKIRHRTRYRGTFDTDALIASALTRIKQIEPIKAPRVSTLRRSGTSQTLAFQQTSRLRRG